MPSCQRIATASLLHSCASLEGDGAGSGGASSHRSRSSSSPILEGKDLFFDSEMTLYATRLAICEISSATTPPTACLPFLPTSHLVKKSHWAGWFTKSSGGIPTQPRQLYPDYDSATRENLQPCLASLSDTPIWISFSNAKQNALHICSSMRAYVDRDELATVSRILLSVQRDVADEVLQSKEAFAAFRAKFQDLSSLIREVSLDLSVEFDDLGEKMRAFWREQDDHRAAAQQEMVAGFRALKAEILDTISLAKEGGVDVQSTLRQSRRDITDFVASHVAYTERMQDQIAFLVEFLSQDLEQTVYKLGHDLGDLRTMSGAARADVELLGHSVRNVSDYVSADLREQLDELLGLIGKMGDMSRQANEELKSVQMASGWLRGVVEGLWKHFKGPVFCGLGLLVVVVVGVFVLILRCVVGFGGAGARVAVAVRGVVSRHTTTADAEVETKKDERIVPTTAAADRGIHPVQKAYVGLPFNNPKTFRKWGV
ncbi:hypothetical protein M433DRAFT_135060 [Acidomyces richmondensis BFW]|nr:MAG: hypothetical protein FE78DRAFT_71619 [Acidomyces sp. 'richmondensis']KYG45038.1 hypothetical protein M433DRAFT_135060 [Acidomyces richmondensis BFW]